MLASLRGLAASSNIKLARARDKAQSVFTSLHGGINIAAASQFPYKLAVSSHLSLLLLLLLLLLRGHPRCLKEQSTGAACPSKIFTRSVLAEYKYHSLPLSDVQHSNKPRAHMHSLTAAALDHTFLLCAPCTPRTHLLPPLPKPSIWFVPLRDLKVGGGKQV